MDKDYVIQVVNTIKTIIDHNICLCRGVMGS